jgi:hypothetical protein
MKGPWPFEAEVLGDVTAGTPAAITITAAPVDDQEYLRERLHLVVASFSDLANCGGFSGDSIRPQNSSARLAVGKPELIENRMTWRSERLAVDPQSMASLFNLFEGCDSPPVSVKVSSDAGARTIAVETNRYPAVTSQIPFELEYDVATRNIDLEVIFPSPLSSETGAVVIKTLLAWRLVGFLGGFRRYNLHPLESNFFPVGEPEITGDTVSMSLEKSTIHDGALDSLINTLVWVSEAVAPIQKVTLV